MSLRFAPYMVATFSATLLVTAGLLFHRYYVWFGDNRSGFGMLSDSAAIGTLSALIISSFWSSQVSRRHLTQLERSAPFGDRFRLLRVTAVALSAAVPVLLLAVVVVGINGRLGAVVAPPVWSLVPVLVATFVLAGAGYAVGPVLRWPALALGLGPVGWGLLGFAVASPWASSLVVLQATSAPELRLAGRFLGGQVVFLVALATLIYLVLGGNRAIAWIAVAATVAAGSAAWLIRLPGDDRQIVDEAALVPVCDEIDDSAVRWCFAAVERPMADDLRNWTHDVLEVAGPMADHVQIVATDRAAWGLGYTPDAAGLLLITPRRGFELAMRPSREDTMGPMVIAALNPNDCSLEHDDGTLTTMGELVRWALEDLGLSSSDPAERSLGSGIGALLSSLPEQQRATWLERHRAELQSCGPL